MRDHFTEEGAREARERWGSTGGEGLAMRVYTSRLIGSDPELVLHGGGNTSFKGPFLNVLGESVPALWVKGSGWDLATIEPGGFTPVDLAFLQRLRDLPSLSDEAMVAALQAHKLDAAAPAPSVETLLHAFLPPAYVDHSHANAILALTNLDDGEAVVRQALGDEVAIVPYVMPGFALAKLAADVYDAHPECIGLVLMRHGLFTFGETAKESLARHLRLVRKADAHLVEAASRLTYVPAARSDGHVEKARAARVATALRGALARVDPAGPPILALVDDEETLTALQRPELTHWGRSGPLTPDHVIRTKPHPLLVLEVDPDAPDEILVEGLDDAVRGFVEQYDAYFDAQRARTGRDYRKLDPAPRVVWFPGVGVLAAGPDARAARIAADLARHTLRLKATATALGPYVGLPDADLFDMEYWSLEQAKLARAKGPASPLDRRVVLVTGGAGAVGVGIGRQLLAAGAHVVLTDVDLAALERAAAILRGLEGHATERLRTVALDVGSTDDVRRGLDEAARCFGGLDGFVIAAGVAVAGELADLTDEALEHALRVNAGGAHRILREAADRLTLQGIGGDIVVISTKNVAAPGASLGGYSASKAAAHQLARVAALELAPRDIRVNLVAPDAVFTEGEIHSGLWREIGPARAADRGLDPGALPAFYRDRNLLKAEITGSDVGRGVVFFLSRQTPTTGAVLPVDGGLPGAFLR